MMPRNESSGSAQEPALRRMVASVYRAAEKGFLGTLPAGSLGGVPTHGVGYEYLCGLGKELGKMSLRPFGGRGFYDPYHEMNRLLTN
jgi:hypothetical protein